MRVGLVCPYSLQAPGGVQNHVLGLARYLAGQGVEVSVLAPGELDPAAARDHHVDPSWLTTLPGAVGVPYNGSVARITFGPRTARRVARWLADGDFDVVHVHEPMTPSASVLAVWEARVPVVATFHTATPGSRSMRLAGSLMRRTVGSIRAGIAVSSAAQQVVTRYLGRDATVIPNGVHVADFANPARRGWRGTDRPRVAFLGRRDEPRKGFDVLAEATPAILARDPRPDLVAAGEGRVGAPDGMRTLGALPDAQRNALLASSDVLVVPNRGRESFGLVLVEAMASGTAVLASDLPAFTEVLDDGAGSTGWQFRTGDADNLVSTLDEVLAALSDGRAAPRLARARARAEQFDWSSVGPRVLDVYDSVLPRHGPSGSRRGRAGT